MSEIDAKVKLAIYGMIADSGVVPNSAEVARKIDPPSQGYGATGIDEGEVRAAFSRLHAQRLLVPEPGDPSRIRMAPPFSGVPTAFPVKANGKTYFANCVWDAYGIAAALHADAVIPASDAHTGEPLTLEVKNGRPIPKPYLAHFAVPAAHWWDDIVFT
jgi:Alkylmercury lyase